MDSVTKVRTKIAEDGSEYHVLHDPCGIGGVFVNENPRRQRQATEFEPREFYACVFFPKYTNLGPAAPLKHTLVETLSTSREAAIIKFMDRGITGETWKQYQNAGWKVRKIKVSDLGPAR